MPEKSIRPGLRIAIIACLVLAVVLVIWWKDQGREGPAKSAPPTAEGVSIQQPDKDSSGKTQEPNAVVSEQGVAGASKPVAALPRLIDLGRGTCIPCKLMMPVLEELKESMKGRMTVQYIDISKDPDAAAPYEVKIIPTQIFIDPDGTELSRHTGFIPREDILKEWKRLGFDFTDPDPGAIDDGGQD